MTIKDFPTPNRTAQVTEKAKKSGASDPAFPCMLTDLAYFLQSLLISSRVLPLVSGTKRQTKTAAITQMMP